MPDDTRPDIPAVPTVAAEPSGAESPAPAPADRSATATGPAGRVQEDAAKARTLLSGALLDELARRVGEYENAITWNTSCLSCPRVLDSAYEETIRREAAEAKLAAQREYDTYRRALWVMVRQSGGSVFLASAQMEDVPLLASLGVGREPGGIRINAGEEP